MRAEGDFTDINQPEADVFAFDFTSVLNTGETINAGSAIWDIGVETGIDPDPESHKVGPAQIQGNMVAQKVSGCLSGVVYWMSGKITTSQNRTLLLWGSLPCGVIGC